MSTNTSAPEELSFSSLSEFYVFYLKEHKHPASRALHYIGSTWAIILVFMFFLSGQWLFLLLVPIVGYAHAWVGHFMFEKNKPATFKWPVYSLICDWIMYKDFLTGRFRRDSSIFLK